MEDYLTIEQAEALLPKIRPLLESARRYKRDIEAIAAHYNYDLALMKEDSPMVNQLFGKLSDIVNQLEEFGCYVKDLDIGLVDFISTFEERDIFLCWKLGEQKITHWHEIDEGFAQRQEIVDLRQLDLELDFETPFIENEN